MPDPGGNPMFCECHEDDVDTWINNLTWGEIPNNKKGWYSLSGLKFDDSTAITAADCISNNDVPTDSELFYVLEPAFITA